MLIIPKDLLGLPEKMAMDKIRDNGYKLNIARRDKQIFTKPRDFRADRVNLEIDRGRVTKAEIS